MTLNTLQVFLTVVEEMNFTRAAQRLFITQQSLSGHIKRLEEEYGVTLFERKPVLRLTAEGENMVFYAGQILQAEQAMVSGFADLSSKRKAFLDLGISFLRSVMLGAGIWKRFHALHPNIQVRLMEANTNSLLESLQRGEIAMMIGVDIRPVPGLEVMPLLKERLCCVVDRDLYARCLGTGEDAGRPRLGAPISVRDLSRIPIMFPTRGNRLRLSLERMYRTAGTRPRILLESERQDVLYQLAREGEGAAILSPLVLYDNARGRLDLPDNCHVFHVEEAGTSAVSLAMPEDARLPHYAKGMADVIVETFSEYAGAIDEVGLLA